MVGSRDTAHRLTEAGDTLDHREIRIRFESRSALLDGFDLAKQESWVEDCHVVLPRLELVIHMAGGFWIQPRQGTTQRRDRPVSPRIEAQAA